MKGKPRVVVDLRKVNTRLYPDAYPLSKQDTILSSLGGYIIFFSINLTKVFFNTQSTQRIIEKQHLSLKIEDWND
jgi:hypothetical protein